MSDWVEVLEGEVVAFLKQIASNAAHHRSNKLADLLAEARQRGARGVDRVLPFLRRNRFLSLDREARLSLTPQALKLIDGDSAAARAELREALVRAFPNRIAIEELAPVMSKVGGNTPALRPSHRPGHTGRSCPSACPAEPPARRAQRPDHPRAPASADSGRTAATAAPRSRQQAPIAEPPADFEIDEAPVVRTARDLRPTARRTTPGSNASSERAHPRSLPAGQLEGSASIAAEPLSRNQLVGSTQVRQKNLLEKNTRAPVQRPGSGQRYARYDALGEGPLCTVFRGRQSALGIDVAIKELQEIAGYLAFLSREALLDRLQNCLMVQASLRHPCIVSVIDIELSAARPYFVLEFCPGGNLRQKLSSSHGEGLDLEEALRIFGQLAHALGFMHSQGFTHGNLKPENLLFDRFGNAKLSDPGLAHLARLDGEKGLPRLFIGTGGLDYLCPEKLRGMDGSAGEELHLGIAADLYGAGVLLYEMLTGRLPGVRAPLPSEVNKHVPTSLDTIFERLTTGVEESRFRSCTDLIRALREAGDLPVRFDASEVLMRTTAPKGSVGQSQDSPNSDGKR